MESHVNTSEIGRNELSTRLLGSSSENWGFRVVVTWLPVIIQVTGVTATAVCRLRGRLRGGGGVTAMWINSAIPLRNPSFSRCFTTTSSIAKLLPSRTTTAPTTHLMDARFSCHCVWKICVRKGLLIYRALRRARGYMMETYKKISWNIWLWLY